MIQQNNTNYTVDGRQIRQNEIGTAIRLEKLSLSFGILSLVSFVIEGSIIFVFMVLGFLWTLNNIGYWIMLIFIALTGIGKVGILLGAIARKKYRQYGVGKTGLILSIIGEALRNFVIKGALTYLAMIVLLLHAGP